MRETFLARKARLDFLASSGRLIAAETVESQWSKIIVAARTRLLACPARIGARIAHLSQAEIAVIDREIRTALAELSEGVDGN